MTSLIVLGLLVFAVIGLGGYFFTIYNGLVLVKNNIEKAWANIDVLLKQRHDEIPKLIKACESYMTYEKGALTKIVDLRSAAQGAAGVAQRAEAEGQLSAGLRQLFALAENYPQLKAQSSFQQLQGRISDLESQLADRREFYNESVNNYNIRIQSLPDSFVASFMSLAPREMFKVAEADRQDVEINIQQPQ
jgi:LemA protein